MEVSGRIGDGGAIRDVQYAFGDPATGADNVLVAARPAGVAIRVLAVVLMPTAAVNARFRSAANSITGLFTFGASGTLILPYNPLGWFQTNAAEALNLNLSGAVGCGVIVAWIDHV